MRAPEPTANLRSEGDHRTKVAARLMRRRTSVGFHPDGDGSQTYALRSEFGLLVHYSLNEAYEIVCDATKQFTDGPWEQVTIRPELGAMSTLVTILSCPLSSS